MSEPNEARIDVPEEGVLGELRIGCALLIFLFVPLWMVIFGATYSMLNATVTMAVATGEMPELGAVLSLVFELFMMVVLLLPYGLGLIGASALIATAFVALVAVLASLVLGGERVWGVFAAILQRRQVARWQGVAGEARIQANEAAAPGEVEP